MRAVPRLCPGSSCVRTAGSSLLSGSVTGLDLGTAHHLHTQGGLSISQGMDEDAPERVCKRCWREVGARAPTVRMADGIMALIYSILPAYCLFPAVVS